MVTFITHTPTKRRAQVAAGVGVRDRSTT